MTFQANSQSRTMSNEIIANKLKNLRKKAKIIIKQLIKAELQKTKALRKMTGCYILECEEKGEKQKHTKKLNLDF